MGRSPRRDPAGRGVPNTAALDLWKTRSFIVVRWFTRRWTTLQRSTRTVRRPGRPRRGSIWRATGPGRLAGRIPASAAEANLRFNSVPPAFATALRSRIIEPFAAWRTVQQAHLAPWRERVAWDADLGDQPEPPHLLLANELLDA